MNKKRRFRVFVENLEEPISRWLYIEYKNLARIVGKRNIFFTNRSAKEEVLQAVLSLGDESVGYAMMDSVISGINWKNALLKREIKFENLVHYERDCTKIKRWE